MTPDGIAVERLALTMAAAVGVVWAKADADTARMLRVAANAALLHLGAEGRATGAQALTDTLQEGAETARVAARLLDHHKLSEDLIQRLHRSATGAEMVARTLGLMAEEDDVI